MLFVSVVLITTFEELFGVGIIYMIFLCSFVVVLGLVLRIPVLGRFILPFDVAGEDSRYFLTLSAVINGHPLNCPLSMAVISVEWGGKNNVFHSVLQVWESVHIVSFMGHMLIWSDMEVKVLDCGNHSWFLLWFNR